VIEPSKVKEAFNRIQAENYAFRAYLKNHANEDELDEQFLKLHKELFLSYDCSKCRNCCKEYNFCSFYLTQADEFHHAVAPTYQFAVWQKSAKDSGFDSVIEGLKIIKDCPILMEEVVERLSNPSYSLISHYNQI